MKEWTSEEVKAFRERLNLYQKDMAPLLGVTREYVNYLEKGVKRPSKTLKLLLDFMEQEVNRKEKEKRKGEKEHGKNKRHLQAR